MDPLVFEKALILTGIGIGTAFGLLLSLMVIISITGRLTNYFLNRSERLLTEKENLIHDRALAAAVAVSALTSIGHSNIGQSEVSS